MDYDLIIFDLDGTLVDSFPFFVGVHNRLAAAHGFRAIEPADVEALRGHSAREMMRHVGLPRWKLPWVARSFVRLMHEEGHALQRFAGVDAALAQLHARGIVLAVVTSNSVGNGRRALGEENWGRFAHVECGASIFGKRRRILRVLRATGKAPARTLYVGDQLTDAQAARSAGVAFGAVAWGYASFDSLLAAGPEQAFASMEELAQLGTDPTQEPATWTPSASMIS